MKKEILNTAEFRAKYMKDGKLKIRKGKRRGVMNQWETWWSQRLEQRRVAGEIKSWKYEPRRLRLAEDAFYTPDFEVINNDGSTEMHEIKGYRWSASIVRFKVAAEMYPQYTFFMVERKNDRWVIMQTGGSNE